jgi:MoaA/NifB/PqqE/SkfB family radical SAM enzyme
LNVQRVLVGFAITQHCNLRCPHCIRDDVTTVRSLSAQFILSVLDQAAAMFDEVGASFTGGEPLLHPELGALIEGLRDRDMTYRFVSNGWHMKRVMPMLDRHKPTAVRLSLSGGNECVHDEERGRGSFRKVLLATALLRSRGINTGWNIIVDRRTRGQLQEVADLTESMGVASLRYILPHPVPGSMKRDSDLSPREWFDVVAEVRQIATQPGRESQLLMDYGAPVGDEDGPCETFRMRQLYVDPRGMLSTCCMLSDYGENAVDIVADLNMTSLQDAWPMYVSRNRELQQANARVKSDGGALSQMPCIRCAASCGKMDWLKDHANSDWYAAVTGVAGLKPRRVLPVMTHGLAAV